MKTRGRERFEQALYCCGSLSMRRFKTDAKVAELADAPDLGSGGETRGGSSPPFRTNSLYSGSFGSPASRDRSGFRLAARTPRKRLNLGSGGETRGGFKSPLSQQSPCPRDPSPLPPR